MKFEWNYEPEVIKEYLSKFYSSKFACVREYVANAIAAHHRAGVKDPVVVEITPEKIVVEDRGTGITRETLEKVFRWFGRSENKNLEGVQGRLGLGAKSFMMLTGSEGKVLIRTRCRETGESYSAIITSTGIEVIEDGGKEDYGTRFEIYPAEPLKVEGYSDYTIENFVDKTIEHFRYSRIPVLLKASSPEKFDISLPEHLISIAKLYEQEKRGWGYSVRGVEVELGIHHEDVEIIKKCDCYEIGERQSSWNIVVIGDVKVESYRNGSYYYRDDDEGGAFIRITVEDGRPVDIMGVTIKAPEPLPNREGYRNLDTFKNALRLLLEVHRFSKKYGGVLGCSTEELLRYTPKGLRNIRRAAKRVIQRAEKIKEVNIRDALARELPGFFDLYKQLNQLLIEFVFYGFLSDLDRGRRPTMALATALTRKNNGEKIYFTRKRPTSAQDHILDIKEITVLYAPDVVDQNLLSSYGIEEIPKMPKNVLKVLFKKIDTPRPKDAHTEFKEDVEDVLYEWLRSHMYPVTVAPSLSIDTWRACPDGIVVVGNKSVLKRLKEYLGDFVNTPEGWASWRSPSEELVTDGQGIIRGVPKGDDILLLTDVPAEALPAISNTVWKKCYKMLYDCCAPDHAEKFDKYFVKEYVKPIINNKTKEAIYLLAHSRDFSIAEDVRIFVREFLPVLGKTEEELRREAKPLLTEELREKALMKLGKMKLGDLVSAENREFQEELDNITIGGLQLPNPLLEDEILKDVECEEAAVALAIRSLGTRAQMLAALAYHHEITGEPDWDVILRIMDTVDIPREEIGVIARLAPNTLGPKLFAALI